MKKYKVKVKDVNDLEIETEIEFKTIEDIESTVILQTCVDIDQFENLLNELGEKLDKQVILINSSEVIQSLEIEQIQE
jgi:hypothetical protein